MEKPVNLNRYRKDKARADRKARADQNAVKFGRTKAQKDTERAETARITRLFDSHKQDRDA